MFFIINVCKYLIICFVLFIFVDKCDECDYTVVVENKRGEKKKMTKDELSMVGFEIVAYSGDARSTLLELLK